MSDPLINGYINSHPDAAARSLERFGNDALVELLWTLPVKTAARLLAHLPPSRSGDCLARLDSAQATDLLRAMPVETAAHALRGLGVPARDRLLAPLSRLTRTRLLTQLRYPQGSVGEQMVVDVLSVHAEMTVADVLRMVREQRGRLDNGIYLVDAQRRLLGEVVVEDLLVTNERRQLGQLLRPVAVSLHARSSLEGLRNDPVVVRQERVPVVERGGRFLGVLPRSVLYADERAAGREAETLFKTGSALTELFYIIVAALLPQRRARGK